MLSNHCSQIQCVLTALLVAQSQPGMPVMNIPDSLEASDYELVRGMGEYQFFLGRLLITDLLGF